MMLVANNPSYTTFVTNFTLCRTADDITTEGGMQFLSVKMFLCTQFAPIYGISIGYLPYSQFYRYAVKGLPGPLDPFFATK